MLVFIISILTTRPKKIEKLHGFCYVYWMDFIRTMLPIFGLYFLSKIFTETILHPAL